MTTSSPDRDGAPNPGGNDGSPLLKIIELIGAIAAPISVITALLYYFGWVRTNAIFRYFGADPALLAFGLPEYLTRSAGTAFKPLVVLLLVTALVLILGRVINGAERRWPDLPVTIRTRRFTARPIPVLLLVGGVVGVTIGFVTAVGLFAYPPAWAALALAGGALAVLHGARRLTPADTQRGRSLVERGLLSAIIGAALFWATAAYSQQVGDQLARFLDANPGTQPEVTIHSAEDLNLWTAPGATPGKGKFPHTYRGLRLLYYANERWFLLTGERSTSGRHRLVIIRDDDSIRVDLSA